MELKERLTRIDRVAKNVVQIIAAFSGLMGGMALGGIGIASVIETGIFDLLTVLLMVCGAMACLMFSSVLVEKFARNKPDPCADKMEKIKKIIEQ